MAKRFTDTEKWKKAWFRNLSHKMRSVWIYLLDQCDHAGVLEADLDTLSYFVNEKVTQEELNESFGDRIEWFDDGSKILIASFIDFQYGALNEHNRVHLSVLNRLHKLGLSKPLASPLEGAMQGAKDKDKDKYKEKEKGKGGVGENQDRAPLPPEVRAQLSKSLGLKF